MFDVIIARYEILRTISSSKGDEMTAWNCPFSKRALNLAGYPCGLRIAETQILVSMTALIAIFLFSDLFYGGQDIGLYLFGAASSGVFVYSTNYIGKLGLPFTGGDDFNGHNLPFGHLDWSKRSEYAVFKNGLNDLGHAITALLNCFALFYHGNKFLSKYGISEPALRGKRI